MKIVLICITSLILIVTACTPESPATEGPAIPAEEPTPTRIPVDLTPAQRAAITTLSENLGVPVEEIRLVTMEAAEWPDGCLGVVEEGLACTEVITSGFSVILEANDRQVEYRTNEDGTQIRPATVAMSWKREGGIAGFCDYMTVYLSGEVHLNSCKQGQYVEERLTNLLSEEEIAKLDEWLATYGNVRIDASDPKGVADRMVVTLTFTGLGSDQTLLEPEKQGLLTFAQELSERLHK